MSNITPIQRHQLEVLLRSDVVYTQQQLADLIHCHQSNISRELKRNRSTKQKRYTANTAQSKANHRRMRTYENRPHWYNHHALFIEVIFEFCTGKSPDQISGRIQREGWLPSVSHQAIYDYIEANKANNGTLYKHLRYQGKKYKFRSIQTEKTRIPNRKDIDDRPDIVDTKERAGDWESDLVVSGRDGSGAIATFAERKHVYFKAILVIDQSADEMLRATKEALQDLPATLRNTMTHDNGKEICKHEEITKALQIDVYCAHPYHSWERPLNEWYNRELRRFFPKGTDFSKVTQKEVDYAVNWLNNCPRRSLQYRTPKESFEEELAIMRSTL